MKEIIQNESLGVYSQVPTQNKQISTYPVLIFLHIHVSGNVFRTRGDEESGVWCVNDEAPNSSIPTLSYMWRSERLNIGGDPSIRAHYFNRVHREM